MGKQVTLTKTIFIAERRSHIGEAGNDQVLFVSEHDKDDPDRFRSITIDAGLDESLGHPGTITITLQPGDVLNG